MKNLVDNELSHDNKEKSMAKASAAKIVSLAATLRKEPAILSSQKAFALCILEILERDG